MRRLSLSLVIVLTACSGGGGSWPTLARRPIEGPPLATAAPRRCAAAPGPASCLPASTSSTVGGPAAPLPPSAPVAIDDVAAKLTVIDRDLTDAAVRLTAQRATATAANAARGRRTDGDAWAKAQVELTALDRVGNQVVDIRDRLDAIAGTLAAANAGGADVAAPLITTGRLIARATALTAEYDTAAAGLR